MAESEEELMSLLIKVKEGSEKVSLKLNMQKQHSHLSVILKLVNGGLTDVILIVLGIVNLQFITSWEINGETMETVSDFILGGSKITPDGDCSHEIKRRLLLGRKVMSNLDSIFKSRDITLLTKVRLVKAVVFQWSCMDVRVGL